MLKRPATGWQSRIQQVLAAYRTLPGVELDPAVLQAAAASLERFLDLVLTWNQRLDLTAARDADEFVDLFVADAALLARFATGSGQWVDVGSGAGAPGIPLKLLRPELQLELVEPKSKRVTFLRTALGHLNVRGVGVRRELSESVPDGFAAWALSRATLPPEQWLREGARLASRGVWVLLAHGDAPSLPGWQAEVDVEYPWVLTGVTRRAVRFVACEAV